MIVQIKEVLSDVFDIDSSQISNSTLKTDIDEWDSMKQLELITALEKKFKIKFTMDEIISIDSVPKIITALEKRQIA